MKLLRVSPSKSNDSILKVGDVWQNNGSIKLTIAKETLAAGRMRCRQLAQHPTARKLVFS